ncbi:PucR family transcriptional regulator [Paenibacillus soyae]|uniref:PucR family transcriptional regulator ligand-binding domain-containing protein n=1 Tax=Paenibacillus soyae TaxID=2969249 RepID=A0A9X2MPS6_9BACL|nr:PucR family transcriptional regulator [Paenibacillus soyae]MCR2803984.1 PucR family transcriptional regulator ligand-binding domain-containing protein [Paenibacillus soyae]
MNQNYQLTIEQILQRPQFRHAYVAAGRQGLNRLVRWVHIIEVIEFEELLQGGEMILTTGAAFGTDSKLFGRYMEQLINRDVSCLCIEIGHSVKSVPEEWIRLADSHGLPLIIFPQAVRFIDITQDIHAHIINRHHDALQDLERISREFHRLTLTSQGVNNVLQLLQRSVKAQVLYMPADGQPRMIPHSPSEEHIRHWANQLQGQLLEKPLDKQVAASLPYHIKSGSHTMIAQPIGAMGKTWAHLALILDRKPQQYEYLILDSASLSIAQDLLRRRYMEERKLYSQTLWVDDLLHLRIRDEEQIKALIGPDFKRNNELPYYVCLIEIEREAEGLPSATPDFGDDALGLHLSLAARSIFEQQAFHPLITLQNNRLVVIAFDRMPTKPAKDRLRHAFRSLGGMKDEEDIKLVVGVGQAQRGYMNAYLSYQEAIQAISLSRTMRSELLFFDELGVFQLLFRIADKQALRAFMQGSLGPLIDHDEARGSELLRTLKVYLDHDGSKQLAAQRLFIVRQSLYYRLEQIETLLGKDFMEPEKRLALQVALRVYQLLNPDAHL